MDTNDLVKLLPPGYEQACFDKKAMTRKRTTQPREKQRIADIFCKKCKAKVALCLLSVLQCRK